MKASSANRLGSGALGLLACLIGGCVQSQPMSAVTFNAGLAVGFVAAASTRAELAAEAAAGLDADVVCVQEVWTPAQVAAFADAGAERFPYQHFPAPQPDAGDGPACTADQLETLMTCMTNNCGDVCVDEQASCAFTHCPLPFLGLPLACSGCIQANVGRPLADIEVTCTTEDTRYAFGGSFGTGILSKWPLGEVDEHVLPSTTLRRSVLHAEVERPKAPIDVYCTHLGSDLAPLPYTGTNTGWVAEQREHVVGLLDRVDATSGDGLVVVLGDLNTGPATDEADAELPDHYRLIDDAGLSNPYVDQVGACTYCDDNPLIDRTGPGRILDHVLVGGHDDATLTAERVLDALVEVVHCDAAQPGAYSDHYAVRVEVRP